MAKDIKTWFRQKTDRVWNEGNLDAVGELYAPDVVIHNAAPGNPGGLEGVKFTVGYVRGAFPDLQFNVDDLIVEGDKIVQRWSWTGTQEGEFMGAPPTGIKTTVSGISIVRIANDKVAEIWTAMTPSN
jgi:predicted ester cyclase